MLSNSEVARLRAHCEGLERRYLMSTMQELALLGPAPEALHVLKSNTSGIYAATQALSRSVVDAANAVAAKALAPFNLNRGTLKNILDAAPLEFAPNAAATAPLLPLPMPDGSFQNFRIVE